MNRTGFSLVEMAVVSLILSLLVWSIGNLLIYSSQRFTAQEGTIVCAAEAAAILSQFHEDIERQVGESVGGDSMTLLQSAWRPLENGVSLSTIQDGNLSEVVWRLDPSLKALRREAAGKGMNLAPGLVNDFSLVRQDLGSDGLVRSLPPDPEDQPAGPGVRPIRTWFKVRLVLEAGRDAAHKPIRQEYEYRFTPGLLNRQLQSIWNVLEPR